MPPRLHRNIWVLSITSFLTDVSSEMLFNLLPLFLVNILGVRTVVVGLIEGIAETTASMVKVSSGMISDRLGNRKRLTILGYALSALVKPLLFFANSWGWVLLVRFSDRVGKGIRSAPRDALLAASASPAHRGLAFGLHRAADTAGAFIGLAIAAWILWASQSGAARLTRPAFQKVVLASILPAILAVILLALSAKEVASKGIIADREDPKPEKLDRRFLAFLAIVVIFTLGNSSDAFIILRGQERGLSVLQVMGMLLTFTAVYSALSSPFGSLSDRLGRRAVLIGAWLFYTAVYLGLAAARTGAQIWALFGLYGVYYALAEGTARAYVADLVPEARRGAAFGMYHAGVGLAALPASLLAGILWQGIGAWEGFGPSAPFYFGALMALLATAFLSALPG
jgi:MFS family permease